MCTSEHTYKPKAFSEKKDISPACQLSKGENKDPSMLMFTFTHTN